SPKNIMIDTQGVVKVTDFGIAKAKAYMRNREGEILMGKVQYMSPEQARFEQTDKRSDVFSLGIVMYEMLAGQNIFSDDNTVITMKNITERKIPPIRQYNSKVPPELEKIMMKALERDRNLRYQSADDFGYELQYYMYHDRFGPTYQMLEAYLKEIFPHFADPKISRTLGTSNYFSFSDTVIMPKENPKP
ncbi:MAG: protein kinase, partial [Planctomycetes bacterium]|nr:protein kinase [Planctomycetota bacterium]